MLHQSSPRISSSQEHYNKGPPTTRQYSISNLPSGLFLESTTPASFLAHGSTDTDRGKEVTAYAMERACLQVEESGQKVYVCPFCQRRMNHKHNFSKHLRTHTGDRPYACTMCSASFPRMDTLKLHMFRKPGSVFRE